MPGNYVHESVDDGTILDAVLYNGRHQNHIDNRTPLGVDDYSSSLTQMRQDTDPGTVGAESLATDFSGELARVRRVLATLINKAYWYDTPNNHSTISSNTTLTASDFGFIAHIRRVTANADITLPAASAVAATKRCLFKNTGAYTVKLLRAGTDTVDGLTQYQIPPYCTVEVFSNGSNAFYLGENPYRASGILTLSDGANISWNHHTQPNAQVTLAGNRTLDNPTNALDGTMHTLLVIQDATGSRTLAYGSNYRWPINTAPVLTTTANAKDLLSFITIGGLHYGVAAFNLA